jgi:hypothetical protein
MKAHALLAAFILPVTIMFIVTGALYTWGIKGTYSNEVYDIELSAPLQPDQAALEALARKELERRSSEAPKGQAKLKTYGDHFLLEWTGSSKDIILEPTKDPLVAKFTIKNTTWYRNFVQVHKAKGGVIFKVYAVVFALALLAILSSGFMMAWQTPKLRRLSIVSLLLGLVSFVLAVYLS